MNQRQKTPHREVAQYDIRVAQNFHIGNRALSVSALHVRMRFVDDEGARSGLPRGAQYIRIGHAETAAAHGGVILHLPRHEHEGFPFREFWRQSGPESRIVWGQPLVLNQGAGGGGAGRRCTPPRGGGGGCAGARRGAAWCRDAGVVPDAFVGDGDSAGPDVLAWVASAVPERVALPCEKDMTDLEAAFALGEAVAAARGTIPAFTLLCATGGRVDHGLGVLGVARRHSGRPVALVGDGWRGWVLSPEGLPSVRVEGRGRTVSAVPLADGTCISERGLHWPLDHRWLDALDLSLIHI